MIIHTIAGRIFSVFCHQQPGLLLEIQGVELPVGIRCGLLYVGIFSGYLVSAFNEGRTLPWRWGLVLVSVMGTEWLVSNVSLHASTGFTRGVTGFLGGLGAAAMMGHYRRNADDWRLFLAVVICSIAATVSIPSGLLVMILVTWMIFWTDVLRAMTGVGRSYLKRRRLS
ncbi:MAG: DUF2085 domain-containing protein [Fidelibacterota bacterium]